MRFGFVLRLLAVGLAVATMLGVVVSAHYYLYVKLAIAPALPAPWPRAIAAGLALLGVVGITLPISERSLAPPWVRVHAWPASLWMGLFFLLFVAFALCDALRALVGLVGFSGFGGDAVAAARVQAAAVCTGVAAAASVSIRSCLAGPADVRVEIPLAGWPARLDGYRVAQISDIHIGPLLGRRFAASLVERVNALAPDLVAVTGDLVDGHVRLLRDEAAPFAGLRGADGVYFVTGNHDHYSGAQAWAAEARSYGWRVLRNEHERIEPARDRGAAFVIAGVDDHRTRHMSDTEGEDLDRALDGRAPGLPTLLLAHDPSTFKQASEMGVALQLSGHTHGGQIWPFEYLVRLAIPFVAGRYARAGAELYVSRGTGFWGPPMRLGAPAEISEIVLRAAPPGDA